MPRRRRTKIVSPTPQDSLNIPNPNIVPPISLVSLNITNPHIAPTAPPAPLNTPNLNSEIDFNEILHSPPSRSRKRRIRRKALKGHRIDQLSHDLFRDPGIFSSGAPSAEAPVQSESDECEVTPILSGRLLTAIEQVWDLEWDTDIDQSLNINDIPPFSTIPNPSNLGQVADHASLMLDVFSRVKPVDDQQLTVVQKKLVTSALTSVLAMTQQLRILEVSLGERLEPLQTAHDDALKVDSGCVVCFERVADMLLMPCRHLALCEVCCGKIVETKTQPWGKAQAKSLRCPICRNNALEQIRICRA